MIGVTTQHAVINADELRAYPAGQRFAHARTGRVTDHADV
jgi:hypothetical protein